MRRGKLEANMTPEQIETLTKIIANSVPGLVRMRPYKKGLRSYRPQNAGRLYVEPDDLKLIIRAALNQK
jgi:hypothetical protein